MVLVATELLEHWCQSRVFLCEKKIHSFVTEVVVNVHSHCPITRLRPIPKTSTQTLVESVLSSVSMQYRSINTSIHSYACHFICLGMGLGVGQYKHTTSGTQCTFSLQLQVCKTAAYSNRVPSQESPNRAERLTNAAFCETKQNYDINYDVSSFILCYMLRNLCIIRNLWNFVNETEFSFIFVQFFWMWNAIVREFIATHKCN